MASTSLPASNIMFQMPLFTAAGKSDEHPAWMDAEDQLDVDLLAEYLLDDVGFTSSTNQIIDFSVKNEEAPSTIVSPEQSEDGGFPPVAESAINPQYSQILHSRDPLYQPPPLVSSAPNVNVTFQIPRPTSVTPANPNLSTTVLQQAPNASKRRRIENIAVALPPVVTAPVHSQQQPQQLQQQQIQQPIQHHHHHHQQQLQQQQNQQMQQQQQQLVAALQQGRGRKKSQAQIDRRRERNRILARRTRLRKKFFFESLQKEVIELQRENIKLKELVKEELDTDKAKEVLESCKAAESIPQSVVEACGEHTADLDDQDFNLVQSIQSSQHSFLITDPCLQDNPIVFASDGFLSITGYSRENVLGRNCRFLQGIETSQEKVDIVRNSLTKGEDVTVTMINYTADGTPFWNKLFIAALRDAHNQIVNFIGVIAKVAGPVEGDPEYGKVLPGDNADAGSSEDGDDDMDAESMALAADGTVKAIEGGLSAAVAAVSHGS